MTSSIKRVRDIGGYIVMRPASNHPSPAHWEALRHQRREIQTQADGLVHCGTCWTHSEVFDLHHRHYNNFGAELIEDVILLCRPCHEAITNRIRACRFSHGDQTIKAEMAEVDVKPETSRFKPEAKQRPSICQDVEDSNIGRFRPPSLRS